MLTVRSALLIAMAAVVAGCHAPVTAALPQAVRAHPDEYCDAALASAEGVAPQFVATVRGRYLSGTPVGEISSGINRATCVFPSATGGAALVTFEVRCADAAQDACVAPLAVSLGEAGSEAWIEPNYAAEMEVEMKARVGAVRPRSR